MPTNHTQVQLLNNIAGSSNVDLGQGRFLTDEFGDAAPFLEHLDLKGLRQF